MRALKLNQTTSLDSPRWCLFVPLCVFFFFLTSAPQTIAQSETTNKTTQIKTPAGVVFPWLTVGIDPSIRSSLQQSFAQSQKQIEQVFLSNPESLTQYVQRLNPSSNVSLNIKRRSNQIKVGALKQQIKVQGIEQPLGIQPLLCSVQKQLIVFATITHSEKNILLSSAHFAMPLEQFTPIAQGKNATQWLQQKGQQLLQESINKLTVQPPSKNALKVGFNNGSGSSQLGEGSNLCLNLLISESLADQFRFVRHIGNESMVTLKRLIKFADPAKQRSQRNRMQRATRKIITYWNNPKVISANEFQLSLKATFAEAVFSKQIPHRYNGNYRFQNTNGKIRIQDDGKLSAFLSAERDSLLTKDFPKISKIYRAWAYLDKGRAWGLKMNDRVVIAGQENEIKGHVVGYYGPEMKVQSPHGYPVREGAIVFIRKGQKKTKLGQTIAFDRRRYPTPYP